MCFVREWHFGFFANEIEPWLSLNIIVGFFWANPIFFSNERNYITSCVAWDRPIYSASVDDKATTDWHFELQETGAALTLNRDIDFLVTTSPAQSESA